VEQETEEQEEKDRGDASHLAHAPPQLNSSTRRLSSHSQPAIRHQPTRPLRALPTTPHTIEARIRKSCKERQMSLGSVSVSVVRVVQGASTNGSATSGSRPFNVTIFSQPASPSAILHRVPRPRRRRRGASHARSPPVLGVHRDPPRSQMTHTRPCSGTAPRLCVH